MRALWSVLTAAALAVTGVIAIQAVDARPGGQAVAHAIFCDLDGDGEVDEWYVGETCPGGEDPDPDPPGPTPRPTLEWPKYENQSMANGCNFTPDGETFQPRETKATFDACVERHQQCLDEDPGNDGVGESSGPPDYEYSGDEFRIHWQRRKDSPTADWTLWRYTGDSCDGEEPPTPEEIRDWFATKVPKFEPTFQPVNKTLVSLKTVFVAQTNVPLPFVARGPLNNHQIEVTGKPHFTWKWNDDTRNLETDKQGHKYPERGWQDVVHEYQKIGTFTAELEVTWTGTFTVDGGAPQPLPQLGPLDGGSTEVEVVESLPRLTW